MPVSVLLPREVGRSAPRGPPVRPLPTVFHRPSALTRGEAVDDHKGHIQFQTTKLVATRTCPAQLGAMRWHPMLRKWVGTDHVSVVPSRHRSFSYAEICVGTDHGSSKERVSGFCQGSFVRGSRLIAWLQSAKPRRPRRGLVVALAGQGSGGTRRTWRSPNGPKLLFDLGLTFQAAYVPSDSPTH